MTMDTYDDLKQYVGSKNNFTDDLLNQGYAKGYAKGRADKYQEIASEYMLLTEKQVAEIRTDVIDELKSKRDEIIRWLIKRDLEGYGTTDGELLDHIFEVAEHLKEK